MLRRLGGGLVGCEEGFAGDEAGDGGTEIFSTTTPLPVAGSVGYTVRVLPHPPLLAGDTELGLVTLA